jgi:hypothetical protein
MEYVPYCEQWISEEEILEKYNLYKNLLFQIAFSYLGNKYDCEEYGAMFVKIKQIKIEKSKHV